MNLRTKYQVLVILVTTTVVNTKINEVENKTPDNSKYITTQEFNELTAKNFASRLKQADLVSKIDFDNKLTSFNNWIAKKIIVGILAHVFVRIANV